MKITFKTKNRVNRIIWKYVYIMGIHNRFFIKVIRLPVETILLLLTKNKNLSEKKIF